MNSTVHNISHNTSDNTSGNISWSCKAFDALTPRELYAIMQLRMDVFVVEQDVPFQDADDRDVNCYHLMGYKGNDLQLYARLLPAGVAYPDCISIGRIISARHVRGKGLGKVLVQKSIEECDRLFGPQTIVISAQARLQRFYKEFGFVVVGEVYLEDGIDHIKMKLER